MSWAGHLGGGIFLNGGEKHRKGIRQKAYGISFCRVAARPCFKFDGRKKAQKSQVDLMVGMRLG